MPDFLFRGFTTGSSVALSVSQGANSASGSVSTWGQGNFGSVQISVSAPDIVTAPAGVFLEATQVFGFAVEEPTSGIYDPTYHELMFVWRVNGNPLQPFAAPQNMLDKWNDPNVAYGKKVAFHFPDSGTYQIDLEVRDRDNTVAFASETIEVVEADGEYENINTVCFSNAPGETWAGEKPGCLRATTFSQLQAAINNATSPLRILFKRGQTVPTSQVTGVLANNSGEWLSHVDAWGPETDPKPIIECPLDVVVFRVLGPSSPNRQFTCANINFRGAWDARTQSGKQGNSPFGFNTNPQDCFYTISQCDFSGLSAVTLSTDRDQTNSVLVADCVMTNWQDYGIYIENGAGNFALIGSRLTQNIDAGNGHAFGKNQMFNQHGPLRVAQSGLIYVTICDMFSRDGWSSLPPDQADQPCMRLNQNGTAGVKTNINRVVCEGGGEQIALSGQDSGTQENLGNHLIDKALLIASAKTWEAFVLAEFGGTTVRNVIGLQLDTPDGHSGNGWQGAVKLRAQVPGPNNLDGPIRVYGNSWINLRSAANDPGDGWVSVNDTTGFSDVTDENNVIYAPNIDTPVNAGLPINVSSAIAGVSPRYKGVQYYPDAWTALTTGGNVGNGGTVSFAYPSGTDQSFWQSRPASDNLDVFRDGNANGGNNFYAEDGAITVSFTSSAIVVTNTSGSTWTRSTKQLKLDFKSTLPEITDEYDQTGLLVPLPRPTANIGNGLGLLPIDDFEIETRVGTVAGALNL